MLEGRASVKEGDSALDSKWVAFNEKRRNIGHMHGTCCRKERVGDSKGPVLVDGVALPFCPFIQLCCNCLVDSTLCLQPAKESLALGDETDGSAKVLRLRHDSSLAFEGPSGQRHA